MTNIRISRSDGTVQDIIHQPQVMTPAKKKPPPPPPLSTRKVKRESRVVVQESTNTEIQAPEGYRAHRVTNNPPPITRQEFANRGRSRSVAAMDNQISSSLLAGMSQEQLAEYLTPQEASDIEAWASQEHAMPPTPDQHNKKKRKTGPLYSMNVS